MFGLGAGEVFFIVVVALVVFGPEKIPEIAKWLGKTSGELRRMSDAVRREFYNGLYVPPPEPSSAERRTTSLVTSAGGATSSGVDRAQRSSDEVRADENVARATPSDASAPSQSAEAPKDSPSGL